MSDLLTEVQDKLCLLTLNRVHKSNAFDNKLLSQLHQELEAAIAHPQVRVILIKAHGTHFSAGADIAWMHSMAQLSEAENLKDAEVLGNLMYRLYHSPKPTIAMVQGAAFGGGAGLVAACDLAVAAPCARFCFSEVQLGLIPAVISPYVVEAIGAKNAAMLFMSAEIFNAERAQTLGLVQHCVEEDKLADFTYNYANKIAHNAPGAVQLAKQLVRQVKAKPIDKELMQHTVSLIAKQRVSAEGQKGLAAFLTKNRPDWN